MKKLLLIIFLQAPVVLLHAQTCITVSEDQDSASCNFNFCGPYDFSKGVYRIPYPDGTLVHCTNDIFKHCPRGAIDMHGASGQSSYNIVAAADGWIRAIHDEGTEQCTCKNGDNCDNNYVWIEHPNGEWTKYVHVKHNSVDDLGLKVDDWVTRGTVIGIEGTVGCSTGNHCHFEVAVPIDTNTMLFDAGGGWIDEDWAKNLVPVFCTISGNKMVSGADYFAFDCFNDCSASMPTVDVIYGSGVFKVLLDDDAIENSHNITFQANSSGEWHAANEITLNVGFEALVNSVFAARLGGCDESALKENEESVATAGEELHQMNLYPNPTADMITLEMKLKQSMSYTVLIRDIAGHNLFQRDNGATKDDFIHESFSISSFANGMYMIEVRQGADRWMEKFMVQH